MASSIVVKVKHGDTLRRFNAVVNENQKMELDIEGLRAKIRYLFNFSADAELLLTYLDEDLDNISLVDEEDLHDVVKQGLNPVRVTVELNTGKTGSARSTGTSTPVSRQRQYSNPNMDAGVADLLKSVPEPLREHLSKLSAEVAAKAASASPVLADIVENLTKVGQSFLKANLPPQSDGAATKEANATNGSQNEPATGKDASAPENGRVKHNGPAPIFNICGKCDEPTNTPVRLNQDIQGSDARWDGIRSLVQPSNGQKTTKDGCKRKVAASANTPLLSTLEKGSSSGKGMSYPCKVKDANICPFSGLPMLLPPGPPVMSLLPPPAVKFPKMAGPTDPQRTDGAIFHRGVRCDGCGVLPITGPRFKSRVKDDYDLCRICFEQMGCDADYIRIDFAAPYRHPWSLKGNPMMIQRAWTQPPTPIFPRVGKHMKQYRPKLDSRFIMDVNIVDGTTMAPKTPFTKIWRMRNNGNIPWTHGTQLIWIGGDKFSPTNSVGIEVPATGFYPEIEVDVAVDFIAPELPGRYISYWKMASSMGQKFGQRIWVLIQVDASTNDVTSSVAGLNLNEPPAGAEPLVNVEYEQSPVGPTPEMGKPLADNFLCDPFVPSASAYSAPPEPETISATQAKSSSVSYPTIEADLLGFGFGSSPALPLEATTDETEAKDDVEEVLLMELEEMGFKQVDLNKEVLRKNDYNLEQSLDELCSVSEWDLLLEELRGMGFVDREVNKRVLAKNNGSLKHAVMDLITRETA